jgi:hypothetical protein
MTPRITLCLLLITLVSSCGKKSEGVNTSPITYEMKTFRLESEGGCKSDTSACASYEINYPIFAGLTAVAGDSLTRKISEVVDAGNPELDTASFELAGKDFIASFEKTKKEFPEQAMGWYYRSAVKVNVTSDTLLSLEANTEFFTGGAHGGDGTYFINLQPSTGKTIVLADVMKAGFKGALQKEGERAFREALHLADTASLSLAGFEFPDDKFVLNDNYGFTGEGIKFVFNIYEVAPYVLGSQQFLIPYAKIKKLLK